MEFIGFESTSYWWIVSLILCGILVCLGCKPIDSKIDENGKTKSALRGNILLIASGVSLVLGAILAGVAIFQSASYVKTERPQLIANQISETYGVDIPINQISQNSLRNNPTGSLSYPTSLPEGDFIRYGTVLDSKVEDGVMSERKITLAWIDGEFRLYGMDENEEVGPELPRVK